MAAMTNDKQIEEFKKELGDKIVMPP